MIIILKTPSGLRVRGCGKMVMRGTEVEVTTLSGEKETFRDVSEMTITEQKGAN